MSNTIVMGHKSASAILRYQAEGIYSVHNVWSESPGQGHATMLMQEMGEWADRNGFILLLTVSAYGTPERLSNADLRAFYEKHGFRLQEGFRSLPYRMIREPSQELQAP